MSNRFFIYEILICISALSLFSCDTVDNKLVLQNLSSDTIFFNVKADTMLDKLDCPLYYRLEKGSQYSKEGCLLPNEKENDGVINQTWEQAIKSTFDGKIKVWFFKKQILDTVNWEEYVNSPACPSRMEFTLEELKKMNWIVVYKDSL